MNFRSVSDLNDAVIRGLPRVPDDVDLVAGVPRSGVLAASLLALHRNLPMTDLDGLLDRRLLRSGSRGAAAPGAASVDAARHVLVVDDSVLGGATMSNARRAVAAAGLAARVTYAAIYAGPRGRHAVDLAFETIHGPRVFEWNLMHGGMIGRSCVDIDGVLCADPTERENDDGPRYERFLRDATPKLVPTAPVGWLVTCRLEKYRAATERWLRERGVRYGGLRMMDLPDKAARIASGGHAAFKARAYRETGATLFIESSERQAREIARLSGRPVLSLETRRMHYPSLVAHAPLLARRAPTVARGLVRRLGRAARRQLLGMDPPDPHPTTRCRSTSS